MNSHENHELPLLAFLRRRESQCRTERRGLEMWLARLTPWKWFTVSAGSILSIVAGATVLGDLFGPQHSKLISGSLALGSSLLTGLHVALKCDAHQGECARLIQVYLSLESAYQAAQTQPQSELKSVAEKLEKRYQEILDTAGVTVPHRFRVRAEKEGSNL